MAAAGLLQGGARHRVQQREGGGRQRRRRGRLNGCGCLHLRRDRTMLQYRNEVVWLAQAPVYLRSARAAAAGASAATMAVRQHSSTCRCCDGSGQRRAGGMGSSTGRCSAAQRLLGLAPLMPPCSHQAAILASCRQASGRRRSTEFCFPASPGCWTPQCSSLHPPESHCKAAAPARAPPGGKGLPPLVAAACGLSGTVQHDHFPAVRAVGGRQSIQGRWQRLF